MGFDPLKFDFINNYLESRYDYDPRNSKVLQANIDLMMFLGLLPYEKSKTFTRNLKFAFQVVPMIVFNGCFLFVFLVANWDVNINVANRMECYHLLVSTVTVLLIACVFIYETENFYTMLDELGETKKYGIPQNLVRINKLIDLFTIIYQRYVILGGVVYIVVTCIFGRERCEKIQLETGEKGVCGMVTPMWLPFDIDRYPWAKITMIFFEYTSGVAALTVGICIACLVPGYVFIIITKIDHLQYVLESAFKRGKAGTGNAKRLRFCIKYHTHIKKLSKTGNSLFTFLVMAHVGVSALVISMVIFGLLQEFRLSNFLYLVGWYLAVYVECYSGQLLTDKSKELEDTIAHLNWYDGDIQLQKDILSMLRESQNYMTIRAKAVGVVSLPFFATIIKTSYSYITLMLNKTS